MLFEVSSCWRDEAVSGGAPAARGCSIEGGGTLFLGEHPLHGAAQLREGECSFWGGLPLRGAAGRNLFLWDLPQSRYAGLLDGGREEAANGGAPGAGLLDLRRDEEAAIGGACAARGCLTEEREKASFGLLPLRGAAQYTEEGCSFWGSSRCAGLLY